VPSVVASWMFSMGVTSVVSKPNVLEGRDFSRAVTDAESMRLWLQTNVIARPNARRSMKSSSLRERSDTLTDAE
jgi:cytidylate kinase